MASWRPPDSILEAPGLEFGRSGAHFPRFWTPSMEPRTPRNAKNACQNKTSITNAPRVGGRRCSPPGGFQSAGHRRCANGVPNSFPTGSVQSQLANLDILSSSSFAQFDLKCSFPYPFLSPGAWGPPQTRRQKAEKFGFFAFLVDFFAFRTALEK